MMDLFPNLKKGKWARINLNSESKRTVKDLSDPKVCTQLIESLQKNKRAEYSYGGYLEDRSYFLRNCYNQREKAFIHLGIDFNVPAETQVALLRRAKVVHIMKDKDMNGGWGERVLCKLLDSGLYLIYGHLKLKRGLKVGRICEPGFILGVVGNSWENGGWFPHLHLQLMDKRFVGHYQGNLNKIDGYLPKRHTLLAYLINPLTLMKDKN